MERAEWLIKVRAQAESLYDHIAPAYWARYGGSIDSSHRQFIEKFLGRLAAPGKILDAACGAGLYDEILIEAGHQVLGLDQSSGMLARAREIYPPERFPHLQYKRIGLQEIDFHAEFDGLICMDALEHICPEDWPGILARFQQALKMGGVLYITVDALEMGDYRQPYERARAKGLPVVFGEVANELDTVYAQVVELDALDPRAITGERLDLSVYHYHPAMDQVRTWLGDAGLAIEEEGSGDEYVHILARKHAA